MSSVSSIYSAKIMFKDEKETHWEAAAAAAASRQRSEKDVVRECFTLSTTNLKVKVSPGFMGHGETNAEPS
jgi:hypothetical protein